jgi:hypothetical protein
MSFAASSIIDWYRYRHRYDRPVAAAPVDDRLVLRRQAGRTDDDSGTSGARGGEMRLDCGGRREVDQHVGDPGERVRVLARIDAAGERCAGSFDRLDDRAAHASCATIDADRGRRDGG